MFEVTIKFKAPIYHFYNHIFQTYILMNRLYVVYIRPSVNNQIGQLNTLSWNDEHYYFYSDIPLGSYPIESLTEINYYKKKMCGT